MTPPIFESSRHYKLTNVKYPSQVADLIFTNPNGPIAGYKNDVHSLNQNWKFNNVGTNQFTIQNATTGTYAFVYDDNLEGVPVTGSTFAYKWSLIDVEPGVYKIATADGAYIWSLESGRDFFSILLRKANNFKDRDEAVWTIPHSTV